MSKGEALFEEFDESARHWGWQEDYGTGSTGVARAERDYNSSRAELLDHIRNLEAAVAMLEVK